MKNKLFLAILACLGVCLLAGCGKQENSTAPKRFELLDDTSITVSQELLNKDYETKTLKLYTMSDKQESVVYKAFDIQIDDLSLITLGTSTLNDLVVKLNEKTEAAGDIKYSYENKEYTTKLYETKIVLENTSNKDDTQNVDYNEKLLIDPNRYNYVRMFIYKYGVPYIRITAEANPFLNNEIKQEGDWVITSIVACPLEGTGYETGLYTDNDKISLYAKSHIWMNNGIRFDGYNEKTGEKLTWANLNNLFHEMSLTKISVTDNKTEDGYYVVSDNSYFYYRTKILGDYGRKVFDTKNPEKLLSYDVPLYELIARINPENQECINIALTLGANSISIPTNNQSVMIGVDVIEDDDQLIEYTPEELEQINKEQAEQAKDELDEFIKENGPTDAEGNEYVPDIEIVDPLPTEEEKPIIPEETGTPAGDDFFDQINWGDE